MEKKKKENIDLIKYLSSLGYAKNKAKTYVRLGFVKVNGKEINKLPYLLKENDIVKIEKNVLGGMIASFVLIQKKSGLAP